LFLQHIGSAETTARSSVYNVEIDGKSFPYKEILTASPLENWRRPPGRPRVIWMKTIQQDLISYKPLRERSN